MALRYSRNGPRGARVESSARRRAQRSNPALSPAEGGERPDGPTVRGPTTLIIRNGHVLLPEGWRSGIDIRVEDGAIERIGAGLSAAGAAVLDARGLTVAPGFIDVHIHGAAGAMCEDADPNSVARISTELARCGVTGFLPTLAAMPRARLRAAVETIVAVAGSEPGARMLGIHLEGPYLSPARAGAQPVAHMRAPSIEEFDELQATAGGLIRLVTVAPELPGAVPFIAAVRERGTRVSVGHTNANSEEMLLGIEAGATHVTHLFNAMPGVHHREPGVIGVGLTDDRVSVEVICDGHHLSPRIVDLTFRCKAPGKIALVSDAVGALGQPDGAYRMFGVDCIIADGAVRLRHGGNLAGSCLSLDRAVRNLRSWLPNLPLEDVLNAAARAPAAAAGVTETGVIAEGRFADLVVLDAAFQVVATICRGRVAWQR
jgi:N-acetylglucosamine-6-phosphate deacetylase